MGLMSEFRQFAVQGNVVDMAVGVIIGAGFGKIVTSFTNDILMPPIGMALGKVDFANLFISLDGRHFDTLAAAKAAAAPTMNIGLFLNSILDFLILAFCIFIMIRQMNKLRTADAPKA